jgi:replication-associated recombination protein RarA
MTEPPLDPLFRVFSRTKNQSFLVSTTTRQQVRIIDSQTQNPPFRVSTTSTCVASLVVPRIFCFKFQHQHDKQRHSIISRTQNPLFLVSTTRRQAQA